jgi:PIN domain nuclease of toxin-antitoxin system
LDASSILAVLHAERGHERVIGSLPRGMISAVNYSEVLKKTVERGVALAAVRLHLDHFLLDVVPFDGEQAARAAEIWPACKAGGLSFADRACLALGLARGVPILTGDQAMAETGLPVKVDLFRQRS